LETTEMTAPEDLVAIRQTLAAYNIAGDRLRIEALADTFVSDGVLATPTAAYSGREEIVAGLSDRPPGSPPLSLVRHHLTTSQVELTGEASASARTYFIVFTDIGPDHAGHYVDLLEKTDGRWRFRRRDVRIDWVAPNSLFPELLAARDARIRAKSG
jgi:hypothetical protein